MKTFKIDDPEIIEIYQDYNDLKFLIAQMLSMRMYLLENEIIKEYVKGGDNGIVTIFTLTDDDSFSVNAENNYQKRIRKYYRKEHTAYCHFIDKYFNLTVGYKFMYLTSKQIMRCFYFFDVKLLLQFKKQLKDMIKLNLKNI